jgi:hypothetical protein
MADDTHETLWNAASLYIASPSGRGHMGSPNAGAFALKVSDRIKNAILNGLLSFGEFKDERMGQYTPASGFCIFRQRDRLAISSKLEKGPLEAVALMIAHEGGHYALGPTLDLLLQEIWVRTLEMWLFRDLRSGTWDYQVKSGGTRRSRILSNGIINSSEALQTIQGDWSEARANRLIDVVLERQQYSSRLTASWVISHADDWGGLSNRYPETRGLYIRVLSDSPTMAKSKLVLRILESFGPEDDQFSWNSMLEQAGGTAALKRGLAGISTHGELKEIRHLRERWHF